MSTPTHQNQDGPAQTVLGITAAAGGTAWFGYHYLNSHAATINLPLLITLLTALCVTLLCAAHTWRATHPRPAEHAATATDRWRLAFPLSSATAATAGAVFTPTLAVTSWACHAPLVPAAGLAAAAAITAAGFTWERYRLQAGRTALRTTLIQALYAPLGHRYPCPAVVPTINWQPKSTVPDNLTIRAQRASIHHHLGDHPAAQLDEDAAPRGDTAATVRKALRAHCNGHYRVATDPSGLRLTATHYVPEKIDEQLTDLTRKVRSVFGPSAMVPAETFTADADRKMPW
jgi:DNA segregation ATPase FtsK/SpoIIIE, S-DNA-T family